MRQNGLARIFFCSPQLCCWLLALVVLGGLQSLPSAQAQVISYEDSVVDVGNIGFTVTNYGTFGRPNVRNQPTGPPSMEYPLNSGIEHLFEAGVWLGVQLPDNSVAVSSGAVDAPSGFSRGASGFELTPLSSIRARSSRPQNQNFSADAVSQQDFVTRFTDSIIQIPGTQDVISGHENPLGAVFELETYAWDFNFTNYFVIANYTVRNEGPVAWDSVYLGMWSDLVVRNINVTQDGGSNFFNKGGNGYIDSLQAIYVYLADQEADDFDFVQSYGSQQFLGGTYRNIFWHPDNAQAIADSGLTPPQVKPAFWIFRETTPGYTFPSNDQLKYNRMSEGLNLDTLIPGRNVTFREDLKDPDNFIQLLSVGPFPRVEPGESVEYAVAFVAARMPEGSQGTNTEEDRVNLVNNLNSAISVYRGEDFNGNGVLDPGEDLNDDGELDRFILPEPPETPRVRFEVKDRKVEIYWDSSSVQSIDPISRTKDFEGYRLYRSQVGEDLGLDLINQADLIRQWDSTGNSVGFNNGFDEIALEEPVTFADDTLTYYFSDTVEKLLNGWQYAFIVTAFDEGNDSLNLEPLESSRSSNAFRIFPGTEPSREQFEEEGVGVYPNPYRMSAAWDGPGSRTRKLYFYNLPPRCEITVYTLSGEVLARLRHDAGTYQGRDALWFDNFSSSRNQRFSGGEHAWDILSQADQSITQGMYMVAVRDLETDEVRSATFTVIK
jgi:hypothetical protein